jgi:periplasmic protein TonB
MSFDARQLESPRASLLRWVGAAVVVLSLHVAGVALALLHPQEETPEEAGGAVLLELAPQAAPQPVDSPDIAHGPLMQEAVPTPQASEKKVEEEQKDIPLLQSSPAPEPEVVMPVPQPAKEPEPEIDKAAESRVVKDKLDQADAAPLTMAPPRVEAEPTPASAAPSPGKSAISARVQASWQKALVDHLNRYKRYPEAARVTGAQGTVVVGFRIDRSGHLLTASIARTSGSAALDEEALAVLRRASPLPAPPNDIAGTMLDLTLPIQFRIR